MAVITARHHHLLLYSSTPEHSEHCSAVLRTLRTLLPSLWELASLKFTSSRSKPSLASAPQVWFLQATWKTFVFHSSLNQKIAIKGLKSFKIFREYNRTRLKLCLSALERLRLKTLLECNGVFLAFFFVLFGLIDAIFPPSVCVFHK